MSLQSFAKHFSTFEQGKKLNRFGIVQDTPHYCFKRDGDYIVLSCMDAYEITGQAEIIAQLKRDGKKIGHVAAERESVCRAGEAAFDLLLSDSNNGIAYAAFDLHELGIMLPEKQVSSDRLPGWFLDKWGANMSSGTIKTFLNAEFVCDYLIVHIEKGYTSPGDINARLKESEPESK